jgi:hypothetical protein
VISNFASLLPRLLMTPQTAQPARKFPASRRHDQICTLSSDTPIAAAVGRRVSVSLQERPNVRTFGGDDAAEPGSLQRTWSRPALEPVLWPSLGRRGARPPSSQKRAATPRRGPGSADSRRLVISARNQRGRHARWLGLEHGAASRSVDRTDARRRGLAVDTPRCRDPPSLTLGLYLRPRPSSSWSPTILASRTTPTRP